VPSGFFLTQISGGSYRVNDAATGDSVSAITIGGVNQLSSTVTWATDDLTFTRLIVRNINANASATYWATHDGTDIVRLWPKIASASIVATITSTETGFTPVIQNVNTHQAFAAATVWNSGNEGADAFTGTAMMLVTFSFAHLSSLDSNWTLTGAECAECDVTTEDQILSVYIGSAGVHTLGSAAVKKTLSTLGVFQGHTSMFMLSAAAQNPVYANRIW
jgi:hypothetical protein